MQISEFTAWLRSRTNKHHRPFQADTIAAYADAGRALSEWMTGQGIDGLADVLPGHRVENLADLGVDVRADLRCRPGGQHERLAWQRPQRVLPDRSNTAAGAAPSSGRHCLRPAVSSDQRAASACICSSEANSRPRQKLSRTYGIGHSTLALPRIVNYT